MHIIIEDKGVKVSLGENTGLSITLVPIKIKVKI